MKIVKKSKVSASEPQKLPRNSQKLPRNSQKLPRNSQKLSKVHIKRPKEYNTGVTSQVRITKCQEEVP